MTEEARWSRLAAAGFNVLLLDGEDVEIDLFTDVPPRAFDAVVSEAGVRASVSGARGADFSGLADLSGLAAKLYGPARYVAFIKGRSAELALVAALEKPGMTVVTHGLFKSTQHALAEGGCILELAPRAGDGACDLDLAWLERRFAAGGVGAVYLEPSNNALGGWPLHLDSLEAVHALARRHGALLLLDATRLLANCLALGVALPEGAHRFTCLADAFTVSCAKELLTSNGAFAAVRTRELERKMFAYGLNAGTLLDAADARARLVAGIELTARSTVPLLRRREQLGALADALRSAGLPVVDPVGAHAVYVRIDFAATAPQLRAVEGLLYRLSGVRTLAYPYPQLGGPHLRLALAVGRYTDAALANVARGVRALFDRATEAPELEELPDEGLLRPGLARFAATARKDRPHG